MPQSDREKAIHASYNSNSSQPIFAGATTDTKATAQTEKKAGFLHQLRIDQKLKARRIEMQENKYIKEADKTARKQEQKETELIMEQLKFEDKEHKQTMEDFQKGRISVQEFKRLTAEKEEATLPKSHVGLTQDDQKRLDQIKKDLVKNKHELDGNPEAEEQYNALAKKLRDGGLDNDEYLEVKEKMRKAEKSGVGLMTKQKTIPNKETEQRILNVQNEIGRLETEKTKLGGTTTTIIGSHGVPNYKDQVIPTRQREKQERQYKVDKTAQQGEDEMNVLFKNTEGSQKKRKAYNEQTGKWYWTSELSATAKRKTDQAINEGIERELEERRYSNNFYEEDPTPDPVGEHEGKKSGNWSSSSTAQSLFVGGIGKR